MIQTSRYLLGHAPEEVTIVIDRNPPGGHFKGELTQPDQLVEIWVREDLGVCVCAFEKEKIMC